MKLNHDCVDNLGFGEVIHDAEFLIALEDALEGRACTASGLSASEIELAQYTSTHLMTDDQDPEHIYWFDMVEDDE